MENILQDEDAILLTVPISHTHYVVPPIGLGYLSTALKRSGFKNIHILDCVKEKLDFVSFAFNIKQIQPKVIGFQVFSYDFLSVKKSIEIVKKTSPQTIILLGGPHVSATKESVFDDLPDADFAFVGEAEIGLPLLIQKLLKIEESISFEEIPGLIWEKGNSIIANRISVINDLDALGFPDWELMKPVFYQDSPQGAFYKYSPFAPIATSRGCPYLCTFCGSGVNMGHKLRLRSVNHVLSEMEFLINQYEVREFHIIDDMFNFHKERVFLFCQGIRERKWNISYTFPNGLRLNQLDRKILSAMKETGAYAFTVGIESGSQRILNKMKKQLTLEMIEEKVNLINDVGLEVSGFFIIGYPDETFEDIKATINFAKKLKIKRAHFSNFLPLPGTEATQRLMEKGELKIINWSELFYSKVPYAPIGITKKELKRLQCKAFLSFHMRPKILFKILMEIKNYKQFKAIINRALDYLFKQ